MGWIELHQEFRDHTKIRRLAEALHISRSDARSAIVSLWLWAIGEARTGDLSEFNAIDIFVACNGYEFSKKVTPELLLQKLISVKIIDERGQKKSLHRWKKYGTRMIDQSKRRIAKFRKQKELGENDVTLQKRNKNSSLSISPSISPSFSVEQEILKRKRGN